MKSVKDWLDPDTFDKIPVAQTAWAILRDSYHSKSCLGVNPQHMAVVVLYMALQSHGIDVPYSKSSQSSWWQVCSGDMAKFFQIMFFLVH